METPPTLVFEILGEDHWPIYGIEHNKEDGNDDLADTVKLHSNQFFPFLHQQNLNDGEQVGRENGNEATNYPDVNVGHVGDLW